MIRSATLLVLLAPWGAAAQGGDASPRRPDRLELSPCEGAAGGGGVLCGTFEVWEDRAARSGRRLGLDVVVLKATGPDPRPDPIFVLAGGPGQAATSLAAGWRGSHLRRERDIVFVDQRGTGGEHALRCDTPGSDDDPGAYLEPAFQPEAFRACLERLRGIADLTKYTTPIAMDDLDEIRAALGYGRINLRGGSYGTRASLVYMRRHPETVRTATLVGCAPIAFTNPLYHAFEAQRALELLFDECEADPACSGAFPELRQEFYALLERLEAQPVEVELTRADTGEDFSVTLTRAGFVDALRYVMYYLPQGRRVPLLIHRAWGGSYRPFAAQAIQSNRGLRRALALGMLLCVTCAEDVARIDPESIPRWTFGTFLGDDRVRSQVAMCAFWPRGDLPEGYGEPVAVDVPTLIVSGTIDPVTPPRWGEEAARHLPRSLHVIAPGAHNVGGPCIDAIIAEFLDRGTVEGLDTSCVETMGLPPFELSR